MKQKEKLAEVPKGAYCSHDRMRYTSCGSCKHNCSVKCHDCGLTWMFNEGIHG